MPPLPDLLALLRHARGAGDEALASLLATRLSAAAQPLPPAERAYHSLLRHLDIPSSARGRGG